MRSIVLVILSALGLAGLFFAILVMQPAHSGSSLRDPSKTPIVSLPPKLEGSTVFRAGEVVMLKKYNSVGQLTSRFGADQYVPQSDGTIHVTKPVAEFFLGNDQHLTIRGDDGNVVAKDVPHMASNAFVSTGPPAPPSRGRLNNVRVTLVDEAKRTTLLTLTTNNVVFDNETYRISTEGYKDAGGATIGDDQVPVEITGQIELMGRGLVVRWNDKDGRLEMLEILHGDVLKIVDPSKLSFGGTKAAKTNAPAVGTGVPLPEALVAADKSSTGQVVTHFPGPATKPQHVGEPRVGHPVAAAVVYQASFYDNVRINQPAADGRGDQILVDNLDRMDVDFLLKQSGGEATTRPAPATRPTTIAALPTQPTAPESTSSTRPLVEQGRESPAAPTTGPATLPAAPGEPPIFVHWTGPLRIIPLTSSSPPVPLKPGDAAVLLVGAPVSIHRAEPKQSGTEEVRCASLLYQTAGEKVWLGKSEQFPQILVTKIPGPSAKDHTPTRLTSLGGVQYSRSEGKVVLSGPGVAEVPLEPEANDPHPLLRAAWASKAQFDFSQGEGDKQPAIHEGHFEGDVDIHHPKVALRSQALDMLFDPPTKPVTLTGSAGGAASKQPSQPNLRQVIATTGVFCELDAGHSKKQMIESNRLTLDTDKADGKLYAKHVNATGNVHAYGDDDLRAGTIDLVLKPSRKPDVAKGGKPSKDEDHAPVELEEMLARDNVIAKSKDGSVATGDELRVTTEEGKQKTVLSSRTQATVTDAKGNVVRGPEIHFDSQDGRARIIGAGSLHAVQQTSATQPAQNVDVTWTTATVFDGAANRIDVEGNVVATSTDKRGYVDTAKGEHVRIDLRPKPATQPAELKPARTTIADSQPARKGAGGAVAGLRMDPFKGKEVSAMTIEDGAALDSTLSAPNGDVLQQFELNGPTIVISEFASDGTASRSVTVPSAGKMLARDHRPPTTQSATGGAGAMGARGATAFAWSRELIYAESTHRADMAGDVVVVHQDDNGDQLPVRMNCDHVIAWFEAAAKSAAGKNPGKEQPPMQLRYLRATGSNVVVSRDANQVIARQVDYDPGRHLLIATGTERNPVTFGTGGTEGGSAERVEWDTLTWKMKTTNAIFDFRPPVPGLQSPPAGKRPATNRSK